MQKNVHSYSQNEIRIFIVAGEHSGDILGGKLISELRRRLGPKVAFSGVGGEQMEREGVQSLFPLSEISIMGPLKILQSLPRLLSYINQAAKFSYDWKSNLVIIIDSPEFTHPIAKRIRKKNASIPIINYVSPSVWAWRSGRAKRMNRYIDHVLALLPFEPKVHQDLGGPKCTYVGHALSERRNWISTLDPTSLRKCLDIPEKRPILVILPGSRTSEISHLMFPFGETARILYEKMDKNVSFILPTISSLRAIISEHLKKWSVPVHILDNEEDKFKSFLLATAALAAAGTVTLELAMCGTPAIVAYKVERLAYLLRFLVKVPSIVLTNLIAEKNIYPEFIQEQASPQNLSEALLPLLVESNVRRYQKQQLLEIPKKMDTGSVSPSSLAADIVLDYVFRTERGEVI